MTKYQLAITLGPIIIFLLNYYLRENIEPKIKKITYRGIDSCIHLIFYSYLLGELGLSSKFDSGWAFWTILFYALLGLIILIPIGIYLRWFKKNSIK